MPQGIALHIGLNSVDPRHYAGWDGALNACEADAHDMQDIAQAQGFQAEILLTAKATRAAVTQAITDAAAKLAAGDIFFLSYSGHGGQLPDRNNDEDDGIDETWVLYEGQLVDDELYALYGKFQAGVRVIILSDSCHSGTVTRAPAAAGEPGDVPPGARAMPGAIATRTYNQNRAYYNRILTTIGTGDERDATESSIATTVVLISGCQDNQYSMDGPFNGKFTGELLRVWQSGTFTGTYRRFHRSILLRMPPTQTPNFYLIGAPNRAFLRQNPFTI